MRTRRDTSHHGGQQKYSLAFLLTILGLFIICVSFVSLWNVGGTLIKPGTYTVVPGSTFSDIPDIFSLDVSPTRFRYWRKFFGPEISLQAGTFVVERSTSLSTWLADVLNTRANTDLTVMILPWWNIYDIDEALSKKGIIRTGDLLLAARDHFWELQSQFPFLQGRISLEWFLYPDTYRLSQSSTALDILRRLLREFEVKIGEDYRKLGEAWYTTLILASIIEREERNTSNKWTVAGILEKRVREGIPMGADATVCYASAKTQKQCTPDFIASVIYEKSPYNTRNKQGYPPTPIANPSRNTWEAAVKPLDSSYYYYLHDTDGVIHYARTLEEHNQNKATYLQ